MSGSERTTGPLEVLNAEKLTIRWTIGKVRRRGFELLRLSIAFAYRLFGRCARYVVCVNTVSAAEAREKTGQLAADVEWIEITRREFPESLRPLLDVSGVDGTGWKLMPVRIDSERYELALDNDCILWDMPKGMREWLQSPAGGLLAEDVVRCLGSFDPVCPPGNFNSGIRGIAPGGDLELALVHTVQAVQQHSREPLRLDDEREEQGLQAAAMCRINPLFVVSASEVSICSPFHPHNQNLGTCGAHFVGSNAHHVPWDYFGRPADLCLEEHWQRYRPQLYEMAELDAA